jgi:hypothetical protein
MEPCVVYRMAFHAHTHKTHTTLQYSYYETMIILRNLLLQKQKKILLILAPFGECMREH